MKKNTHDILRDRLLSKKGLLNHTPVAKFNLKDLERSEWSPEFERLMRNRMIMGALRYVTLEEKRRSAKTWDLLGAVRSKILSYQQTGNTEYLVDVANYCLLEFEAGKHPLKHFHASDSTDDHCKLLPQKP